MASRHRSRELAVQMTYQWSMAPQGLADAQSIERFWKEQSQSQNDIRPYFEELVRGVATHWPEIDQFIEKNAQNWRLDRIEKVELAVLRVAIYEMLYRKDVPPAVVIDEALEISKKFCNSDSPSFINGILDSIVKQKSKGEA